MPAQQEFHFIDTDSAAPGNAPSAAPATADALLDELRALWRIPFIGQKVRVTLRNAPVDEMTGHLEIAEPFPDYPFNPAKPLHLRIDSFKFTHTQITSCALL